MHITFSSISEMDFRHLMNVYEESNSLSGARDYPKEPANLQIIYAEQDFYAFLQLFFRTPDASYHIWSVQGAYVAAVRLEPYDDGFIVEALETAPLERRKGYAKLLMRTVIESLSAHGNGRLYSHIDKENVVSLRLHEKCGFSVIANDAVYVDGSHHADSYTLCLEY